MRKKIPSIPCPKCGGAGTIALPIRLEEALSAVRYGPGNTIPEMLVYFSGIRQAALNKRLMMLQELKLVRRESSGHSYKWYPIK